MSIPLKNDKAKWVFLNNLKGERHKNNVNKFELIQKNKTRNNKSKKLIDKKRGISNKSRSLSRINEDSIDKNVEYSLREMNYTQFYRSPLNTYRNEDREEYASPRPVTLVKKGENKNSRRNRYYSVINSSNSKSSNDNIEELSGESYE